MFKWHPIEINHFKLSSKIFNAINLVNFLSSDFWFIFTHILSFLYIYMFSYIALCVDIFTNLTNFLLLYLLFYPCSYQILLIFFFMVYSTFFLHCYQVLFVFLKYWLKVFVQIMTNFISRNSFISEQKVSEHWNLVIKYTAYAHIFC
jgi:hypothetical protein